MRADKALWWTKEKETSYGHAKRSWCNSSLGFRQRAGLKVLDCAVASIRIS